MNKKQVIRINENQLKQIVMESVKRVLTEESESDYQWKNELRAFMRGLRSGDYFTDNDTVYVQIWKRQNGPEDPRYVYFRKGDTCLHDDHFYMQDSPRLSTRTLNTINNALGWNDEYDDEY